MQMASFYLLKKEEDMIYLMENLKKNMRSRIKYKLQRESMIKACIDMQYFRDNSKINWTDGVRH